MVASSDNTLLCEVVLSVLCSAEEAIVRQPQAKTQSFIPRSNADPDTHHVLLG